MSTKTRIQTRALSPAIGIEVLGVDLSEELDAETFGEIERTFNGNGLLLFRNQKLTPGQHVALSRRFGRLQSHVLKPYLMEGHPELLVLSNILQDGKPIGIGDAGQYWHSDTSYTASPCRCSLLYSREVPAPEGDRTFGDTMFSSLTAAYEALDDAMKARLAPLTALHSYAKHYARMQAAGSKRPDLTEEQKREVPVVEHPVVRPHPITGRKAIYVNDGYTTEIVGLPKAESDELLDQLFEHTVKPEFTYRHKWQVGDLLIWDNWQSQHLAITDYKLPQRRLMNRTTVLAD
ncbi:TauD/TfdA family dioxygenase [Pigmentiphaga soli]|uniref:TauD/TfdA family dioxygenase n=1 Tax=Pigmentiphaga soli TaxID=1007095 RepID=A0ABP8H652_9BURK